MDITKYKHSQLKYLSSIVGSSPSELQILIDGIDDLYTERKEIKADKKTGLPKKYKDGTTKQRVIRPSNKRLKLVQSAIKTKILDHIPFPKNVYGGVKGKSNIQNAKCHQGHKYIFSTDLLDFFPSVNNTQVHKAFLRAGYSSHMAFWLTRLTTWKYELPQGTPTSTHIANLVMLEVDDLLIPFCEKYEITYTRFVDDLTFSSQKDFKHLINDLLEIIKSKGFKISYRKTYYKGDQVITGIKVLNNYIDAPDRIKEKAKLEKLTTARLRPYTNYVDRIRKTNNKK